MPCASPCGPPAVRHVSAAAVVEQIAGALRDPQRVAHIAGAEGNVDVIAGVGEVSPWTPHALEGHAGVAVLFAELSEHDRSYREVAHRHLAAAVTALPHAEGAPALYQGPVSVAFAAACAARQGGNYRTLLAKLDAHITAQVARATATPLAQAGTLTPAQFDVISGLAGTGRYLLIRREGMNDALTAVLSRLVEITEPIAFADLRVPGWLVRGRREHRLTLSQRQQREHFNLGLAHGIPGPLALLALAWRQGVRVEGQRAAIERISSWLLEVSVRHTAGPGWPNDLTFDEFRSGEFPRHRPGVAWCYGTPGVARALHLAGQALGEPAWTALAVEAMTTCLTSRPQQLLVSDSALCHGWSGLLQIASRMAQETGNDQLRRQCDQLRQRILDMRSPDAAFIYEYRSPHYRVAADRAGLLEGAAGIALALLTTAVEREPEAVWDSALMIA